ncbi:hypothetical protein [Caballeronia catudaia]|uniref:hypothetical protein n=1 Tax=Caballeronia catudaia TaxID=1777136 RepID=UPI0013575ABE|nr:hypothetical protein [Caballeronia catudaia]
MIVVISPTPASSKLSSTPLGNRTCSASFIDGIGLDAIDGAIGAVTTGTNAGKVFAVAEPLIVGAEMSIDTPSTTIGSGSRDPCGSAADTGVNRPCSILIEFASSVPLLADDQSAAKVLILVHVV